MSKTSSKKAVTSKSTDSVVTRNKSAQQGRQLRKIDRSMKSITQLLKSPSQKSSNVTTGQLQKTPVKDKNLTVKKANASRKSYSDKKVSAATGNSLHDKDSPPNISKRSPSKKKITLKSKYEMKVIAKTNKRKLNTPHRGLISPPSYTKTDLDRSSSDIEMSKSSDVSFSSELTMADVVRLAEETDCLDDEDLMEILTCPSPVWWEDPPDHNYVEDPIYMRIPTTTATDQDSPIISEITKTKNNAKVNNDIIVRVNDKRLVEKRNKLEKILGNIKNKFNANKVNNTRVSNNGIFNKTKDSDLNKLTLNSEGNEYDVCLSDISVNGEELLRELESMDIPIGGDVTSVNNDLNNKQSNDNSNNIFKIKLFDNKLTSSKTKTRDILKTMPQLKQNPVQNLKTESLKSPVNVTEDATSNSFDSISDSNLHYLDEVDSEVVETNPTEADTKVVNDKLHNKSSNDSIKETQFFVNEDKKKLVTVSADTESIGDFESYINKSDYITVYKIMTQKYINDDVVNAVNNKEPVDNNNGRKKIKIKIKDTELNSEGTTGAVCCNFYKRKSFIPIPDSNKKLCLRCSAIYEISCALCANERPRNREECTCDAKKLTPNNKTLYPCNACEFTGETLAETRRHFKTYHCNDIEPSALNNSFTVIKDN